MTTFGVQHSVGGLRVSDQFTVTDAVGWTLTGLTFYSYQTGSTTTSTITEVNYNIWDGSRMLVVCHHLHLGSQCPE
ncbi:MAG: hypothetical protein IPL28_27770 [Chloroflexi bacterium]|nr:hypothetical protein [Chloroflexota bacterium]